MHTFDDLDNLVEDLHNYKDILKDDLKEVQIQLNKALRALEKGKYTEVEEYIDNANEFLREWLD